MATIKIKGLVSRANKDGTLRYYRRVTERVNGKQSVFYKKLPHLADPNFAIELAKINAIAAVPVPERATGNERTMTALILAFRKVLPHREGKKGVKLSKGTLEQWNGYLKQIDAEHGHRVIAELRAAHLKQIQNSMRATPGKANGYMSRLKVLLQFAADDLDWIKASPMGTLGQLKTGERIAWPGYVIKSALDRASPALRLAIITGLCSGQRISDVIRMLHDWVKDGVMTVPASKKTATPAYIPMHPVWVQAIAEFNAGRSVVPLTLLCRPSDGQPYATPSTLQTELREIMVALGHVKKDDDGRVLDKDGNPWVEGGGKEQATLYSFHGLSKNAICYLTELGLNETTISAIVGKTVETVRYYAAQTQKLTLAMAAAATVIQGDFGGLVAGKMRNGK